MTVEPGNYEEWFELQEARACRATTILCVIASAKLVTSALRRIGVPENLGFPDVQHDGAVAVWTFNNRVRLTIYPASHKSFAWRVTNPGCSKMEGVVRIEPGFKIPDEVARAIGKVEV